RDQRENDRGQDQQLQGRVAVVAAAPVPAAVPALGHAADSVRVDEGLRIRGRGPATRPPGRYGVGNRSTGALATSRTDTVTPGISDGASPVTVICTVAWPLPAADAAGDSRNPDPCRRANATAVSGPACRGALNWRAASVPWRAAASAASRARNHSAN